MNRRGVREYDDTKQKPKSEQKTKVTSSIPDTSQVKVKTSKPSKPTTSVIVQKTPSVVIKSGPPIVIRQRRSTQPTQQEPKPSQQPSQELAKFTKQVEPIKPTKKIEPRAVPSINSKNAKVSIVILGYDDKHWDACISSIKDSTPKNLYELILIDNRDNKYNIFTGYNYGVSQSTTNTIVFIHEDVRFKDSKWLSKLNTVLSGDVGTVGVIGSKTLKKNLTWWDSEKQHRYGKIIHGDRNIVTQLEKVSQNGVEVVSVDGVFLATTRSCFNSVGGFDTHTYEGFHLYDIDYCVACRAKGYKVKVVDILIQHLYTGNWEKDSSYFKSRVYFWNKVNNSKILTAAIQLEETNGKSND